MKAIRHHREFVRFPDAEIGIRTTTIACSCLHEDSSHKWARDWLTLQQWTPEAWAVFALSDQYCGKHDGGKKIPQKVRKFADAVWQDVRAGLISTTTKVLP